MQVSSKNMAEDVPDLAERYALKGRMANWPTSANLKVIVNRDALKALPKKVSSSVR